MARINERYGLAAGDRIIFEALARLEAHAAERNKELQATCAVEHVCEATYAMDLGVDVDGERWLQVASAALLAVSAVEREIYDLADPVEPSWTSGFPRHVWMSARFVTGWRKAGESLKDAGRRMVPSLPARFSHALPRSEFPSDPATPGAPRTPDS